MTYEVQPSSGEPNDVELLLAGLDVRSISELRQLVDHARVALGYEPLVAPPAGTFTFESVAEISLVRSLLRRRIAHEPEAFSKKNALALLTRMEALP